MWRAAANNEKAIVNCLNELEVRCEILICSYGHLAARLARHVESKYRTGIFLADVNF